VFVVRLTVPTPLLALCARLYGGAQAEDFERQVRDLNDLRFLAGMLLPGEYLMPATGA
jgi:hypothetical protein